MIASGAGEPTRFDSSPLRNPLTSSTTLRGPLSLQLANGSRQRVRADAPVHDRNTAAARIQGHSILVPGPAERKKPTPLALFIYGIE